VTARFSSAVWRVLNLTRRNLRDHDGAGVHVGGAFLAFRAARH
jgi:hypothetical protein